MMLSRKLLFTAAIAMAMVAAHSAFAADDLQAVLHKLDTASANFRTTSADFEFDTVNTLPIFDKDVQKGVAEAQGQGRKSVLLLVATSGGSRFIAVDIGKT